MKNTKENMVREMKRIIKYIIIGAVLGAVVFPLFAILPNVSRYPGYVEYRSFQEFRENFLNEVFSGMLIGCITGFLWALCRNFKDWLEKKP